jgi:hypothetical protein
MRSNFTRISASPLVRVTGIVIVSLVLSGGPSRIWADERRGHITKNCQDSRESEATLPSLLATFRKSPPGQGLLHSGHRTEVLEPFFAAILMRRIAPIRAI